MSKKRIIEPFKAIDAASMGADITSAVTNCKNLDNMCYQVKWSGGSTPVGEIFVQVTNDDLDNTSQNPEATATWTDLDFGSAISVSGNSGNHFININQNPGAYIRLFYDRASGSGTMTATLVAKGMGG